MNAWTHELSEADVTIFSNKRFFFSAIQAELHHQIHTVRLQSDPDVLVELGQVWPYASSVSCWQCLGFKTTFFLLLSTFMITRRGSQQLILDAQGAVTLILNQWCPSYRLRLELCWGVCVRVCGYIYISRAPCFSHCLLICCFHDVS